MSLIYKKIPEIMSEMGSISKTKTAMGYKYRGIEDLYVELQKRLAKAEVFCVPDVLEQSRTERTNKNGTVLAFVELKIRYTFYASDGSNVEAIVIGEAMDSGDKACNKAMSVAQKYALIQTFCIPTSDAVDPEQDTYEVTSKEASTVAPKANSKTQLKVESHESPEDYQIPFGADMGKRLSGFDKEALQDRLLKLNDYINKNPKAPEMYRETAAAIELVLGGQIKF